VEEAVLAGADGVLARACTPKDLCETVQRAADGADRRLSDGEVEWLRGLAHGGTVRHLAEQAGCSERMMYRLRGSV